MTLFDMLDAAPSNVFYAVLGGLLVVVGVADQLRWRS